MNYKETMLRFIKTMVVITVLIVIVGLIFYASVPAAYYTPAFPFLLAFFLLVSIGVYHFMLKAVEKRPARFVGVFMLTTMLKLFSYMIFLITYALMYREDARAFIVTFFILYVIFTIVEVISLLRMNKDYVQ